MNYNKLKRLRNAGITITIINLVLLAIQEKLIERLKNAAGGPDGIKMCQQAATALSTLQAELESVRAERNAAVEDVAAIIGDVEEIRRGYDLDNADADGAFAELCETYCANNGCLCYAECEKYHCKNFKWRGQKED